MPPSKRRGQLKAISLNKQAKTGLDNTSEDDNATIQDYNVMTFEDVHQHDHVDGHVDADNGSDAGSVSNADTLVDSDDAGSVSDAGSIILSREVSWYHC